jgi:two-component system, OmpR family, alkaline phosphatase synthesis response regulator PhoP
MEMSGLILLVDDEYATRYMLRLFMEMEGFSVVEAGDGLEALDQVAAHLPDALVLDVMMPQMDGISVCKQLRNRPQTADIPIILLSGKVQDEAVQEGLGAGANLYMSKPMDPRELVSNLHNLLSPVGVSSHAYA